MIFEFVNLKLNKKKLTVLQTHLQDERAVTWETRSFDEMTQHDEDLFAVNRYQSKDQRQKQQQAKPYESILA